jgi:hypothetical protein
MRTKSRLTCLQSILYLDWDTEMRSNYYNNYFRVDYNTTTTTVYICVDSNYRSWSGMILKNVVCVCVFRGDLKKYCNIYIEVVAGEEPIRFMMNKGMKNDSGGPKKKMVIKPFSSKPKVPEDFEMSSWKLLENAVEAVCTNTAIDTSKEVLYRTVEDLCLHKFSVSIYDKLREKCKVHINTKVDSLSQQVLYKPSNVVIVLTVNQSTHPNFLEVVDRVWKEHCEHMLTIRNIFLYLDQ